MSNDSVNVTVEAILFIQLRYRYVEDNVIRYHLIYYSTIPELFSIVNAIFIYTYCDMTYSLRSDVAISTLAVVAATVVASVVASMPMVGAMVGAASENIVIFFLREKYQISHHHANSINNGNPNCQILHIGSHTFNFIWPLKIMLRCNSKLQSFLSCTKS